MMTKGIIAVAAAFMLALTVGILTANMAESGNDRASNPTIRTLVLQDYSCARGGGRPAPGLGEASVAARPGGDLARASAGAAAERAALIQGRETCVECVWASLPYLHFYSPSARKIPPMR